MPTRALALGLLLAAGLNAQGKKAPHSFNWQNYCFEHSAAPFCAGNDYSTNSGKAKGKRSPLVTRDTSEAAAPAKPINPALTVVGGIDWYFVDPFADAILGINVSNVVASPLVHSMINELGAKQGMKEDDLKQVFDRLKQIDQLAISVRDTRIVVMLTGSVADSTFAPPEAGMKVTPAGAGALLVGRSDVIDQAMGRIALKYPTTEIMGLAQALHDGSDFWVIGSARLAGPQALSAGLKRFSFTANIQDAIWTDTAYEFNGAPTANALKLLQGSLGQITVDGTFAHSNVAVDSTEASAKIHQLVNSPVGQQLGALIAAAKYLPVRDTATPKQTRPVILGLDSH